MKHTLATLPLSNSFAGLPESFYSRVAPTPFERPPHLVHFNPKAAALLGMHGQVGQDPSFVEVFGGAGPLPGGQPLAMLYAGHQFGHYVPQLGDGRAIVLGEVTNARGEKWEIQLKGSGLTPYSRDGDGRAVLRSSIREYLCSEAMHGLGIPTTRALCLIGSNEKVYREQIETGAMLTRLAPSHIRFGSFEVFYYRDQFDHVRTLADFVITHHYAELVEQANPYLALLQMVVQKTARLIAQWQAVGFSHGVMNTDNMSILGLTLDYGPFGFMEAYDPGFICNHSDYQGRYAFNRQQQIGLFNLSCLAQAMLPLIEVDAAKAALAEYKDVFATHYRQLMVNKLGLDAVNASSLEVLSHLLEQMHDSGVDYTRLFRRLADVSANDQQGPSLLRDEFIERERFDRWLDDYRALMRGAAVPDAQRRERMNRINPKYVLRNYMAQIAIDKATREGDYSEIDVLLKILHAPFNEHPEAAHYAQPPPDWASALKVSCSS